MHKGVGMARVEVTREAFMVWLVWLDLSVVGTFDNALDALSYASMLEVDPHYRIAALAS